MPLVAGSRLGPYEIQVLIGAGGTGEGCARDTRLGRTVAIKLLPPDLASDARGRADHQAHRDHGPRPRLSVKLTGVTPKSIAGRVLTASTMTAHNTFGEPNALQPAAFTGATLKGDTLQIKVPAKSVVVLTVE